MSSSAEHIKLPLPQYLKLLTNGNVPVAKAMAAAGKIYKEYGSPSQLALLTDFKLKAAGIEDVADRKLILAAFRKAGFAPKRTALKRTRDEQNEGSAEKPSSSAAEAGPSSSSQPAAATSQPTSSSKRRRTLTAAGGGLDFNEVVDEDLLKTKYIVVNRAPVMTAWATVVAERLNFKREEALSIASVYTEMNAVSKGISLGLYDQKKEQGLEASANGAQPYVELIGRRPVYRTQDEQWRALSNSNPVSPMTAFGYLTRSFRQALPHVIGAMRLLAESYDPSELNVKAWALYTSFRPEIDQWGKKSQLFCSKILALRKKESSHDPQTLPVNSGSRNPAVANAGPESSHLPTSTPFTEEGTQLSLEEYEAALDEDHTFDEIDLDFSEPQSSDAAKV